MNYNYKGTDASYAKKVKFICKTNGCKVEVVSRFDHRAILGRAHARHCPRSKKQ
jgi:hypothetical protein